jgi:hypothetical protein
VASEPEHTLHCRENERTFPYILVSPGFCLQHNKIVDNAEAEFFFTEMAELTVKELDNNHSISEISSPSSSSSSSRI